MKDVIDLSEYTGGAKPPEREPLLPLLTLEELREQSQSIKWLVKHVIPAESVGVFFGAPETFKSFIAIDLALHVAHGIDWLGHKTQQGPVIIVAAEGGSAAWKRICAWHQQHHRPWNDVPVYVVPVGIDLGNEASRLQEAAAAACVTPALVIVDTLAQTFSGEENSASEMSHYLRELGLWFRSPWQCAVLVIHHTGHSATERPRGSSAIHCNTDFMFGFYRDEKEMLATVECYKQKDGEKINPLSFGLNVRELATDEDGDPITSLVATGIKGAAQMQNAMDYEASHGRGGRNHRFLDFATNGIEEKKLRMLFCESIDGDATVKRVAYFRARQWALKAGLVEFAEGFVIRLKG